MAMRVTVVASVQIVWIVKDSAPPTGYIPIAVHISFMFNFIGRYVV